MMKVLDLFSGIGGFSLGLERAGMETIAFCEIEPFCQKVLKKHWPDVPVFNDIRNLTANELPEQPDVICGGYPCQPFSVAGDRRGQEDDRHLWPEMFRLVKECRPSWIIGENVAGHITMGVDEVLSDLEGEGYTAQTFVIPAVAVDAPHRRDRVWVIANNDSHRCKRKDVSVQPRGQNKASAFSCRSSEAVANTNRQSRSKECNAPGQSNKPGQSCRCITESWGKARWPAEPSMGRVANGIPRRLDRLRSLGNSVVPQIPEVLGKAILAL